MPSMESADAPSGVTLSRVVPSTQLTGTLDVEATARRIPRTYVLKGMFFSGLVSSLGAEFEALASKLDAPPRLGRYVPFSDYPQSDYLRVSARVAQKTYPNLSIREALRRLGRRDYDVFAGSTFGKIMLSVVGDAQAALHKVPMVYTKVAPGDWTVTSEQIHPRTVRLEFAPSYGSWEYQLGQLEGVVMNFRASPSIIVSEIPDHKLRFDVSY